MPPDSETYHRQPPKRKLFFSIFGFIFLIAIVFLSVYLVRLTTENRGRATGSVVAVLQPAAVQPNGTYTVRLTSHPTYSGPVYVKSWTCPNRLPGQRTQCSAIPTQGTIWKDRAGNPYRFQNGSVTVNLADWGGLPEKLYYAQYAITDGTYSNTVETNVTRNAYTPAHATTPTTIISKITTMLSRLPVTTALGLSNRTLSQMYAGTGTDQDAVNRVISGICGAHPGTTDLETAAQWSGCSAAFNYVLMIYHAEINDQQKVQAHAYNLIHQMDSLVSSTENPPLHGGTGSVYRLKNTHFSRRYIHDFGGGVFSGLGWMHTQGKIARIYCTPFEYPYTTGKQCKDIDLHDRVNRVATNIVDRTAQPYDENSWVVAWNEIGRSITAKISGHSQYSTILNNAYTKLAAVYPFTESSSDFIRYNIYPPKQPLVNEDIYQHFQILTSVNDWSTNIPSSMATKNLIWANDFFDNYFDPVEGTTQSLGDISRNTYNRSLILSKWPGAIGNCGEGEPKFYHTHPNGITSGLRGEPLSDAITTSGPVLYHLLKNTRQPGLAQEVYDLTYHSLDVIEDNPPLWQNEVCNPATALGTTPKTALSVTLRQFGFLYFTREGFKQTRIGRYTQSTSTGININSVPTISSLSTNATTYYAPSNIVVSATASDSNGTVSRVEFYRGSTLVGSDTTAPYSYTWSSAPAGTYTFSAVAIDNANARSVNNPTLTRTVATNSLPVVSTVTTNATAYIAPATITVSARASDLNGTITRVEFYRGSTFMGSDTTSPYSYIWSNVPFGRYTFTAVAVDNANARSINNPTVTRTVSSLQLISPTSSATSLQQ